MKKRIILLMSFIVLAACARLTAPAGLAGSGPAIENRALTPPFWRDGNTTPLKPGLGFDLPPSQKSKSPLLAYASIQSVEVNGQPVALHMYALKDSNGNLTNYVRERDAAWMLQGTAAEFNIYWDGSLHFLPGQKYVPDGSEMKNPCCGDCAYTAASFCTYVSNTMVNLNSFVLHDESGGGYTYYKLRDLGAVLGFHVDWSAERGILVNTGGLLEARSWYQIPAAYTGFPQSGNKTLYILIYHHFVPDGQECNDWITSESMFREDLQWLTDHGYTFVLPRELVKSGGFLPEKAVMLTFDDGYASNYEIAYPLLKEYHAKASIALITGYVQDKEPGYLTWDMCREMAGSGLVEIGSHGCNSHKNINIGIRRLENESQENYEARILPDIQASIDQIRSETGSAPLYFSYPYGKTDAWADAFIRENFSITVSTVYSAADLSRGLYNLPRYNIGISSVLGDFLP